PISSARARSLSAGWSPTPRSSARGRTARLLRSAQEWPSSSTSFFGTREALADDSLHTREHLGAGPVVPETIDERHHLDVLGDLIDVDVARHHEHRNAGITSQVGDAPDRLAAERLLVEEALTGHDQAGGCDAFGQLQR